MLETDPGNDCGGEDEVKEAFVGDGEDDKDGRKGEEDYQEAVEVVSVCAEGVEEGNG